MTFSRTPVRAGLWLAALAALCGLAGARPAAAAVYYVSNSGNDANAGTSPSTAWATISRANSRVAPGDIVNVEAGTYSHFPNPGVSGTEGARITFVGNLATPASVRITSGGTLSRSHVTIKGFDLAGGFSLSGTRDSIAFCDVGGTRPQIAGADDCVITRCRITARRFWVFGSETDTLTVAERDTISYTTVTLDPNDLAGHTMRFKALDGLVFKHVRFHITIGPNGRGASATKLFHVRNTQFIDCSWDISNGRLTDADEAGWFVLRDMTMNNSFVRDTVILRGPGPVQFFGAASGTYPGTVMNNNFIDCVFKAEGPCDYGYAFYYQDKAQSDTLRGCLIVGGQGGLQINGVTGETLVDRCTIAALDPPTGALNMTGNGWIGNIRFENTIFYTSPSLSRSPTHSGLYANYYSTEGHFTADHNLYFGPNPRQESVYASGLGASGPGPTLMWCTSEGLDCASVYGDPKFANSSSVSAFDANLLAGSWASGTGRDGADIGSRPFSGPDTSAPSTVADVTVAQIGDNFVTLQWTAPGDDDVVGRPSGYDLRWSESPITDENFASATSAPGSIPPQSAGGLESFTVFGLSPARTYYFALRARDEASNWSATSNTPAATTHATDITPPAKVTDLTPGP